MKDTSKPPEVRSVVGKTILLAIAACIAFEIGGGLLFLVSGTYNIAADQPHLAPTRWLLVAGRTRSIAFRSREIHGPKLRDPALVRQGIVLYQKNCQPCHGAPGVANDQIGRGIDPKPPQLVIVSNNWTDSELFWITTHGLKLSGMPGFAPRLSEKDLWSIVAFLRRLVLLSPADYKRLTEAADLGLDDKSLPWVVSDNDDCGFSQLKARGNSARGRELLGQYGCISCHEVPGAAGGNVGPPLTGFAERQYVAGALVNVPSNAAAWIADPKRFKPQTAMPNLGVQPEQALDMVAFLYTLGSSKRLTALERILQTPNGSPTQNHKAD